jgi:hypothetical protein
MRKELIELSIAYLGASKWFTRTLSDPIATPRTLHLVDKNNKGQERSFLTLKVFSFETISGLRIIYLSHLTRSGFTKLRERLSHL